MSAFSGKWKRVSFENVDAVVAQVAGSDAGRAATLKAYYEAPDLVEEYTIGDASATRKVYVGGELKYETVSPFGQDIVKDTKLGKTTINGKKVSDTCIEIKETAEGRTGLSVANVVGDTLTLDYTVNGVTMRRVFKKM